MKNFIKQLLNGLTILSIIQITTSKLTFLSDEPVPNCKVQYCETCHAGTTGEDCDKCIDHYGVDRKFIGDDLCVECKSAVPHCSECSNMKIWWSCLACEDGYRVIQVQDGNDLCVPNS